MKKLHILLVIMLMLTMAVFAACSADNNGNGNDDSAVFSRGAWDGDVFTSAYSGVTFTKPADWVSYTDEELASLVGMGAQILGEAGRQPSDELLAEQTIPDMGVYSVDNANSINIIYENTEIIVDGEALTVEGYFDSIQSSLQTTANHAGLELSTSTSTQELSGHTYDCLNVTLSAQGETMNQYCLVRKIDNYFLTIIISTQTQTLEDIVAMFS